MLKEFKEFALKGNVLDLAVAVIIGGAFGKIITSLVNDIIMPLVGAFTGGINFSHLAWIIKDAQGDIPAVTMNYGAFIQSGIDFIIIALSLFFFIRMATRLRKVEEATPEAVPTPEDIVLLTEIRDLLKR